MHGHAIDEDEAVTLASAAYANVQEYIVGKHELHSVKHITNAPRRFESHKWFGGLFKCKESVPPTLLAIEAGWERVGEWIDEPAGY